jgi:hypothetical protein
MPTFKFVGRVLPRALDLTIDGARPFTCYNDEIGIQFTCLVTVNKSMIEATCDASHYNEAHIVHYHREAYYVTRTLINLVAFKRGCGLTIAFEAFVTPSGEFCGLAPIYFPFAQAATAFELHELDEMFLLAMADKGFAVALSDLIHAASAPYAVAINSARAIETLRQLFAEPGDSRAAAWARMRERLRLTDEYLRFITDHSVAPRHGDITGISGFKNAEISLRAWTVMNRFIVYRRKGSQPLPEGDYPLL